MKITKKDIMDKGGDISAESRKTRCWPNILACITMPIEGLFFFGAIAGYPSLAEIYKTLGVYEDVCITNDRALFNLSVNGTINCPERDIIFTYVLFQTFPTCCNIYLAQLVQSVLFHIASVPLFVDLSLIVLEHFGVEICALLNQLLDQSF